MKKVILLLVILIATSAFAQKNLSFLGNLTYGSIELSDIWGYVDTAGNEYALVGLQTGVSIVDVSNPAVPNELFFVPGPFSDWRDIKIWSTYAYITNEKSGGLQIIDLSNLPSSIVDTFWNDTIGLNTAHNLYIDENGFAYIFGSNVSGGGALILDLTSPLNPVYMGNYGVNYVHDGFVRGDTLWSAEINAGMFGVVDVSNKSSPTVLATQSTPNAFAHNTWPSDDGTVLFTTDERSGAYIAAYDVSTLGNITELDRYRTPKLTNVIPHNVFFLNNYLVNSYYTEGVTMVDATKPDNLVEIGYYDTSPYSGNGYLGAWGVYPYLPSGNIIVSDIDDGLFILSPNYTRACYLEGTLVDSATGVPVNNIKVEFIGSVFGDVTNLAGEYKTGVPDSGLHDIRFSSSYCQTKIIPNVSMQKGVVTILNDTLICTSIGIDEYNPEKNLHLTALSNHNGLHILYDLNSQPEDATQLLIYDIYGKRIRQIQITTSSSLLHIKETFSPGIYFVRLEHNSIFKSVKFIKAN